MGLAGAFLDELPQHRAHAAETCEAGVGQEFPDARGFVGVAFEKYQRDSARTLVFSQQEGHPTPVRGHSHQIDQDRVRRIGAELAKRFRPGL